MKHLQVNEKINKKTPLAVAAKPSSMRND